MQLSRGGEQIADFQVVSGVEVFAAMRVVCSSIEECYRRRGHMLAMMRQVLSPSTLVFAIESRVHKLVMCHRRFALARCVVAGASILRMSAPCLDRCSCTRTPCHCSCSMWLLSFSSLKLPRPRRWLLPRDRPLSHTHTHVGSYCRE